MTRALKQAWWAPVAALLVLGQIFLAISFGFSGDGDESKLVSIAIALAGAAVLAFGIWKRPDARGVGNALVVVGAAMAAFWFWTLIMPIVALVVVIGVAGSAVSSRARTAKKL